MGGLATYFSANGRIGRKPFAIGVVLVYALIFLSQGLLSPVVTARANILPFTVLQALLTYAWYALHAKRLRDAGRKPGAAIALAVLYAMSLVLFLLLIELVIGVNAGGSGSEFVALVFILFMIALFTSEPSIGLFFYLATVMMVLIFLPLLIAICLSIWLTIRPSAAAPATS